MTIRSTICTLALIGAAAAAGCNSEESQQPADNEQTSSQTDGQGTEQAGNQAAASGFGVHIGSYEQAEGLTETWTTPEEVGSRTLYYDPNPFLTSEHIAEFTESEDEQGYPALSLRLTDEGAELLRAVTTERIGEPIVLTVEGDVLTAPTVQSTISRFAQVSGHGDPGFIERLEAMFAEAGVEGVDRLTPPDQEPAVLPTVGIYLASEEQAADLNILFNEFEGLDLWMAAEPMLTEEHIESATISSDNTGRPALELTLTDDGAAILDQRADDYVGNYFVFTWQGSVVSAPRVMNELGRKVMITGPVLDPDIPDDWMNQIRQSLSE